MLHFGKKRILSAEKQYPLVGIILFGYGHKYAETLGGGSEIYHAACAASPFLHIFKPDARLRYFGAAAVILYQQPIESRVLLYGDKNLVAVRVLYRIGKTLFDNPQYA